MSYMLLIVSPKIQHLPMAHYIFGTICSNTVIIQHETAV